MTPAPAPHPATSSRRGIGRAGHGIMSTLHATAVATRVEPTVPANTIRWGAVAAVPTTGPTTGPSPNPPPSDPPPSDPPASGRRGHRGGARPPAVMGAGGSMASRRDRVTRRWPSGAHSGVCPLATVGRPHRSSDRKDRRRGPRRVLWRAPRAISRGRASWYDAGKSRPSDDRRSTVWPGGITRTSRHSSALRGRGRRAGDSARSGAAAAGAVSWRSRRSLSRR